MSRPFKILIDAPKIESIVLEKRLEHFWSMEITTNVGVLRVFKDLTLRMDDVFFIGTDNRQYKLRFDRILGELHISLTCTEPLSELKVPIT